MNSDREPNDFTIVELKEKLKELGLSLTGNKPELIARLNEADPAGTWMRDTTEVSATNTMSVATPPTTADHQREIEMYRREKELADRELTVLRAELRLLREVQRRDVPDREQRVERNPATVPSEQRAERDSVTVSSKLSITAVADMLGYLSGDTGDYGNWEQQLTLLRRAYGLTESYTKILISMRLKGKALEWFHSNPTRVESTVDDLLSELRDMFDHRPSKVELRRTFERRVWQRGETFHEYVHAKTILANRVPINEDEVLDYIIDGIPVMSLRDQACVGGYTSKASLLRAFERVTLRERVPNGAMKKTETTTGSRRQDAEKVDKKEVPRNERRCFNCGQRNHVSVDCPTKAVGPKCFSCGERGHVASKCVQRQKTVSDTDIVTRNNHKRYVKEVAINDQKVKALIDTGSDICLMRAEQYIKIGTPKLEKSEIRFRGIGSGDNVTLGKFSAIVTIDSNDYPMLIHVVSDTLMKHSLLIGTDFLDTVKITMNAGDIIIDVTERIAENKEFDEICQIDLDFNEANNIDITHVSSAEHKNAIEHRSGKSMAHVDALSRHPLPQCMLVETDKNSLSARLEKAQQDDVDVKRIFDIVKTRKIDGYVIRGNVLFKEVDDELRIVVPVSLRSQIIRQAHERGHFSVAKTEALLNKEYWIPHVRDKIQKVVRNCVSCILAEKKPGKQEGFLSPIAKGEVPLDTYHIDHLGPLPSTKKRYNHIFLIVDAFSKFVWLYATKTTSTAEVLNILRKQSIIFGNPRRIISDRGTAFTSNDFQSYCKEENIEHVLITTGVPRANGQAERVNRTLIPLLTKLADPKRDEWYKHLGLAQQCLNTTLHRSLGTSPFNVLFGTHARLRDNCEIRELLEREWISEFQEDRDEIRDHAKDSIAKIQRENKRGFDKKRKRPTSYSENDLVAIKRTQQGPGLKLANKFLGPYKIVKTLRNNRYIVRKVGNHEGPLETSTAADYIKPWANGIEDTSDEEEPCDLELGNLKD